MTEPPGAHFYGVISQDASHTASAVGDGEGLAGGLVGGGVLRVEPLMKSCKGRK